MSYDEAEQQVILEELYGLCTSDEEEEETRKESEIIEEAEDLVSQLDSNVFEHETDRVCELLEEMLKEQKFVVASWLVKTILPPIKPALIKKVRDLRWKLLAGWLLKK